MLCWKGRFLGLLLATASPVAGASTAPAQELAVPSEVVLYIHADLKRTDFVRPLVCALQRVLSVPVSTRTSSPQLGPELRATSTQFDVGKVADLFIRTTAADGDSRSFKYLLIPHDLKAEPLRYVFAASFGNEKTSYHVGVLSTARLNAGNAGQQLGQGSDLTAMRAYKLILKSIARVAGLKSPDACVLAFPRSLDELDRKSPEFCANDRAVLVRAGILNEREEKEGTDCIAVSHRQPVELHVAARTWD